MRELSTANQIYEREVIERLGLLSPEPDVQLDDLLELLVSILRVPVALISFVDGEVLRIKSKIGTDRDHLNFSSSPCFTTMSQDEIHCREDLLQDLKYVPDMTPQNAAVSRFYGGLAIHSPAGDRIGTLSVYDTSPRLLTELQRRSLASVVRQIERVIGTRVELLGAQSAQRRLIIKRLAISTILEGVLVQDRHGVVIDHNPAALEMLGLTAEELTNKSYSKPRWKALKENGDELASLDHPSAIANRTWQPQLNVIMGIQRSEDDICWIKVNSVPLKFKDEDEFSHTVTSFTNITEMKRLESKIIETAKLSALGEVAGNIAHEINNPLAVIQGKLEQLRERLETEGYNPEIDLKECDKIGSMATRITKIVSGLRSQSRNSAHDDFEDVPLTTLISDSVELLQSKSKISKVQIEVPSFENVVVKCRPAEISQIVVNLLSNSFDAIEDLTMRWIRVRVEASANFVSISVIDSGTGIAPEVVEKMMHSFFTTKRVGKGTGLGLTVSQVIAQNHGGSLKYQLSDGNTSFVLRLPSHGSVVPLVA